MKIKTTPEYSSITETHEINEYISHKLWDNYQSGEIEIIKSEIEKIQNAFGELIEILTEKKILDANDIMKIVKDSLLGETIELVED